MLRDINKKAQSIDLGRDRLKQEVYTPLASILNQLEGIVEFVAEKALLKLIMQVVFQINLLLSRVSDFIDLKLLD